MSIIGNKIRYLLKLEGLSIADLSKEINISRYAIDNVIYGKSKRIDVVHKICVRLNIELNTLLDDSETIPNTNHKHSHIFSNNSFLEGNFSVELYSQIVTEMVTVISKNKSAMSKKKFIELIDKTYLYVTESPENINQLKIFIQGLLAATN